MIKKILPFLCSLAPLYAFGDAGDPVDISSASVDSISIVSSELSPNQYGNVSNPAWVGLTATNGVTLGGNLMLLDTGTRQTPTNSAGDLYILNTVGNTSGMFGITSGGNVSVSDSISIVAGRGLNLSAAAGKVVNMSVAGNVLANGSFVVDGAASFSVTGTKPGTNGTITSADLLSLRAGTISVAGNIAQSQFANSVPLENRKLNIEATSGALSFGGMSTYAPTATIKSATTITSTGAIQNSVGDMTILSSGNFVVSGAGNGVQNTGSSLTIDTTQNSGTGTISIAGVLSSTGGNLNITSKGLSADSFVNAGNAELNIDGVTSFANGMDLSGMLATSVMNVTTNTLSLGVNNLISNNKSDVTLAVSGGALNAGTVVNGQLGGNSNVSAKLSLSGVGVSLAAVQNYGNLLQITNATQTTDDDIGITDDLRAAAGTQTNITAYDELTVGGSVVNSGNMSLRGKTVDLATVTNTGAGSVLNVLATAAGGTVHISGVVTNENGTTTINSQNATFDDVVKNKSGTLTIRGAGVGGIALSVNEIAVEGGVFNINSWSGGVETNALSVTGGVLNFGDTIYDVTTAGNVNIGGNVYLAGESNTGTQDVRLNAVGGNINFTSDTAINIAGDIIATDNTSVRNATFDAPTISVNAVNVQNKGHVKFGTDATSVLDIVGALSVTNNGKVDIYSGTTVAGTITESDNGLIKIYGPSLIADAGAINIADGIYFDGSTTSIGMVIDDSLDAFTLKNTQNNSDMTISGGISVSDDNLLTLNSAHDVLIYGDTDISGALDIDAANSVVFNAPITTSGNATIALDVNAKSISVTGITNDATAVLAATNGTFTTTGAIVNNDALSIFASGNISLLDVTSNLGNVTIWSDTGNVTATGDISVADGTFVIDGDIVTLNSLELLGGTTTVSASQKLSVVNWLTLSGNLVQGTAAHVALVGGALKLADTTLVEASSLDITSGEFIAKSGATHYVITGLADLGDAVTIANDAITDISAATINASGDVINNGTLSLATTGVVSGVSFENVINNGNLSIDTNGSFVATSFNNGANATTTIISDGMNLTGPSNIQKALNIANNLYQNYSGTLVGGDVNIIKNNYTISASGVDVAGINQYGPSVMTINTSDLTVGGDINATNLTIAATPSNNWSNIAVGGNVSGGVKVYGLEHMTIGGDYVFDDNSLLHAAVLPYAVGSSLNSTTYNYWADVSLNDDNTLGQITNLDNNPNNALVHVGGRFISNISAIANAPNGVAMDAPQIGINLYNVVDQGKAIWLLYAENGLNDLAEKIRGLNVNFCNSDGSICFNYFDAYSSVANTNNNGTENELPIYLSVRDFDNNGTMDSLYIVFDSRFGGPATVFGTESVVDRTEGSSDGEKSAADALDNMIAGQLDNAGFNNDKLIDAIPGAFAGTNLSELANELYNRMEQYLVDRNGAPITNIARLVQPRELEQVAGSIALNEHTSFRDFEDRMFNEFIWNRNRSLNNAWFDAEFGFFRQNATDDKTITGNRFSFTAGFDWQSSNKTILGLMARVSHMSGDNSDKMDLSYRPGETVAGHNKMTVADTNIGVGGYLMHTLGFKTRVYGNAMLDLHLLDVSREQNFVDNISGVGTDISLISEWGLMHDWLNQYIVGNLYTRFGYNLGFDIKEKSAGDEYMRLKSDGYFILTPGYSLTAQKRIYTSPWFQLRPYATIGIEYDLLGSPDVAKFKFAPADKYSEYDIDVNPLWANIGGGIEMLSANGAQVGFDYRYQYNNYIQIHNLKLSGSLRF